MESTTAGGVMKALGVVLLAAAVLVSAPADGAVQADLSGVWDLTVMTDQGEQMLTVRVSQSGQNLIATGDAGEFGTIDMKGTVDGDSVRLVWELDLQGTPLEIVFLGTLADGSIAGTADFGGMGQGDWRAERADD
jgi:hypothetical protein